MDANDLRINTAPVTQVTGGGTTYTFPSITALLANQPSQIQVLGDTSAPDPFNGGATGNRFLKQYYLIGYAQDEWKIRPNFTMSYGLRYEYYGVMHEDRNLFVLFNADRGQIMPNSTPWYNSSKTNFGPRLAFTWAPTALKNKTVFRVGAGYFFGPGQTEDQIQPIEADRMSTTVSSGAGLLYPFDANIARANFINNPNNRTYQPRAYANQYTLPEKVYQYTASMQQELGGGIGVGIAYVGSQGRCVSLEHYGASAAPALLFQEYGLTADAVAAGTARGREPDAGLTHQLLPRKGRDDAGEDRDQQGHEDAGAGVDQDGHDQRGEGGRRDIGQRGGPGVVLQEELEVEQAVGKADEREIDDHHEGQEREAAVALEGFPVLEADVEGAGDDHREHEEHAAEEALVVVAAAVAGGEEVLPLGHEHLVLLGGHAGLRLDDGLAALDGDGDGGAQEPRLPDRRIDRGRPERRAAEDLEREPARQGADRPQGR